MVIGPHTKQAFLVCADFGPAGIPDRLGVLMRSTAERRHGKLLPELERAVGDRHDSGLGFGSIAAWPVQAMDNAHPQPPARRQDRMIGESPEDIRDVVSGARARAGR
jgi:hypothetical protein